MSAQATELDLGLDGIRWKTLIGKAVIKARASAQNLE
jgi:hypothetical protein